MPHNFQKVDSCLKSNQSFNNKKQIIKKTHKYLILAIKIELQQIKSDPHVIQSVNHKNYSVSVQKLVDSFDYKITY